MKTTATNKGIFIIAMLAMAIVLLSFSKNADFSGTWTYNESKSEVANSNFLFAWQTITITQTAEMITLARHGEGQQGSIDAEDTAKLNGEVIEYTSFGDAKKKASAKWLPDNSLVISSEMNFNGTPFNQKETFSLDASGKVLTLLSETTSGFGDSSRKLIYDKK